MKPFKPSFPFKTVLIAVAGAFAFTCLPGTIAFAQHGGGHAGGGHVGSGGGGHVATPHVSAPHASAPAIVYLPPAAGTGTHVAPPVHLIPPPGSIRPVLGNHVMMPPVISPVGPHVVIGFPRTPTPGETAPLRFSPVTSFSGEGHEIWQDAARPVQPGGRSSRLVGGRFLAGGPQGGRTFPRRPIFPRPIFPIFGPPGFGFFGSPFFGLGWGFGFNSPWWPTCGPYWGWGYGCNALPYYGYGLGYGYVPEYGPSGLEAQVENETGPEVYENPAPNYFYTEEPRELVQLYLKDGTIYNVTDYWLVNDRLHFTTLEEGGTKSVEHAIEFDQLDLQKTIDINTARGFRFILRNEPIDEYLQNHPDASSSGAEPQTGPSGPLQPPAPPEPGQPQQPGEAPPL